MKIEVKKDREEIRRIISINLGLMVSKKTKKEIIINYPMVENVADGILLYFIEKKNKDAHEGEGDKHD